MGLDGSDKTHPVLITLLMGLDGSVLAKKLTVGQPPRWYPETTETETNVTHSVTTRNTNPLYNPNTD
jgi:hypothetical protein